MKTTKSKAAIAVVLTVAVAMLALAACGGDDGATTETTSGGDVEVLAASEFSVADYAGKPLVVNFFGSWCGPCQAEAPDLAEFARGATDAQVVGIAVNDTESDALAFMAEYGMGYPLVIDDNSLGAQYGITGVPTTIFFDAQGQEKDRIIGAAGADQFSASLAKAQ